MEGEEVLCPQCGAEVHLQARGDAASYSSTAQQRIESLEAQLRFLTEKASAAADKLADYEDAFHHQAQLSPVRSRDVSYSTTPIVGIDGYDGVNDEVKALPPLPRQEPDAAGTNNLIRRPTVSNRLANFLTTRRGSPAGTTAGTPLASPLPAPTMRADYVPSITVSTEVDNASLLAREVGLRQAAEASLAKVHSEMEELSASLFEQANGMVSEERRARAAIERDKTELEERTRRMESRLRLLEGRDSRMDMLEEAVRRVGRVRHLLGEGDAHRASMSLVMTTVNEA